jgi:hypothetical protein
MQEGIKNDPLNVVNYAGSVVAMTLENWRRSE